MMKWRARKYKYNAVFASSGIINSILVRAHHIIKENEIVEAVHRTYNVDGNVLILDITNRS